MDASKIAEIILSRLDRIDRSDMRNTYLFSKGHLNNAVTDAANEIVSMSAKDAKPAATLPDVSDVDLNVIRWYLSNDGKTQVQYEKYSSGDDLSWKIGNGSWMDAENFIRDHSDLLPLREAVAGEVAR